MKKPQWIHVHGRRWRDRVNGNTYHSVMIWVDGEVFKHIPFTYGYGGQWEWTAAHWLVQEGYLTDCHPDYPGGSSLFSLSVDNHTIITTDLDDVARKKDL